MKLRKHHATATFTSLAELELPADLELAGSAATTGPNLDLEDEEQEVQEAKTSSAKSYLERLQWERERADE